MTVELVRRNREKLFIIFRHFFSSLASKLNISNNLISPQSMPEDFRVKYQRKVNLRRNGRHTKTFNAVNKQN
jgi:hypothetical protein